MWSHTHAASETDCAGDFECAGHAVHVTVAVASAYESSAHGAHRALPGASLKNPRAHSTHGPPSGPENPASHKQSVWAVLCCGDELLCGHAWHASSPWASMVTPSPGLKVFALHGLHSLLKLSYWKYPARQKQSDRSLLAPKESEKEGQLLH